jgi:hypothetical protein
LTNLSFGALHRGAGRARIFSSASSSFKFVTASRDILFKLSTCSSVSWTFIFNSSAKVSSALNIASRTGRVTGICAAISLFSTGALIGAAFALATVVLVLTARLALVDGGGGGASQPIENKTAPTDRTAADALAKPKFFI